MGSSLTWVFILVRTRPWIRVTVIFTFLTLWGFLFHILIFCLIFIFYAWHFVVNFDPNCLSPASVVAEGAHAQPGLREFQPRFQVLASPHFNVTSQLGICRCRQGGEYGPLYSVSGSQPSQPDWYLCDRWFGIFSSWYCIFPYTAVLPNAECTIDLVRD